MEYKEVTRIEPFENYRYWDQAFRSEVIVGPVYDAVEDTWYLDTRNRDGTPASGVFGYISLEEDPLNRIAIPDIVAAWYQLPRLQRVH